MNVLSVAASEWRAVADLVAPFVYDDEHLGQGYVHLVAEGGWATWSGRGRTTLVSLRTACGDASMDTLLAPRLVYAAAALAARSGVLTVASDGPGTAVVVSDGATRLELVLPELQPPDVGGMLEQARAQPLLDVAVSLRDLRDVVEIATSVPECHLRGSEFAQPVLWMEISPGRLALTVEWEAMGPAHYSVVADCQGSARLAINPLHIRRFCNAADVEEVVLRVPLGDLGTLVFEAGDWVACALPMPTGAERYRVAVEQVLADLYGPQATIRDADGDYCLPRAGTATYARLVDTPDRLQVFAVAVSDVKLTPELLGELNDFNQKVSFVRTFWTADQVLVEGEIMAGAVDAEAVTAVCRSLDLVASQTAPILASMFGGTAGPDAPGGSEWFWNRYAETIIAVETAPGVWVDLNGLDCVPGLPLAERVHVLTAWDPGGRPAPAETNQRALGSLVAELWASGASLARASGRSPDGTHLDEGVAVAGLDRDAVRAIGASYGQDAIFEVDASTVTLVSCLTDRVATASRFPQLTLDEL